MPPLLVPYHLTAAVVTLNLAVGSSIIRFQTRERESSIKLPRTRQEGDLTATPRTSSVLELECESDVRDPFEVVELEDCVDGYAVDEDGFWKEMRLRKVCITITLLAVFVLEASSLGCVVHDARKGVDVFLTYALRMLFSLYLAALSASSIASVSVYAHKRAVIHLAVLTATAACLQIVITILSTSSPATSSTALDRLWLITLVLYVLSTALIWTLPTGPQLYYPPERIYSTNAMATNASTTPNLAVGTLLLYQLIGPSCIWGLLVIVVLFPLNSLAGKLVVRSQDGLMQARDARVALTNEILGAIRTVKFMAWERAFERRVLAIRTRELGFQRTSYTLEVLYIAFWDASPLLVTLAAFWHFTVWRGQTLTPSIAFPTVLVFEQMRFVFNSLPEASVNVIQSFVSLRRIERYLLLPEIVSAPPPCASPGAGSVSDASPKSDELEGFKNVVKCTNATLAWPRDSVHGVSLGVVTDSTMASGFITPTPQTPGVLFSLVDVNLCFPPGELSLVCGKLGSGKTLLMLALLGEADVLAGQVVCPRSPPESLARLGERGMYSGETGDTGEWTVPGICAYVPQKNILFGLPYNETRYQRVLEVCELVTDLKVLEDGDESEIGDQGVNLSGGQKARVSLARAVYSRVSLLLLDDVLSAVDAHTAHHLYYKCIKGDLAKGRTVILISHHVQLCASGANYIVALEGGHVAFAGDRLEFLATGLVDNIVPAKFDTEDANVNTPSLTVLDSSKIIDNIDKMDSSATDVPEAKADVAKKGPRKLVGEEKRAVGAVSNDVWATYFDACGKYWYWSLFVVVFVLAALAPVAESYWLKIWSGTSPDKTDRNGPMYYIGIYAALTLAGVAASMFRYVVLYAGSIEASDVLYKRLLDSVLFAPIRFHNTISRGRLLNRFGKDFEAVDSRLAGNFGHTLIYALSLAAMVISVTAAGGLPFFLAALVLGAASRDMRRLDSVGRSPLYSLYGANISGATVLRAFGASSKFMRDMLRRVDTQISPTYWQMAVNLWLSARYDVLATATVGLMGDIVVMTLGISASLAGFILSFAVQMNIALVFLVRRYVSLEQSMVALERIKEYIELDRELPEFVEPSPALTWPDRGAVKCENLVIRYAPDVPNALHSISFEIHPGEKVGILGRTVSGKSTLALSFFRSVEATEGRILIDEVDISKISLTDLRSNLTIIPQDPTILSGTIRSALDVFNEYEDAEIFEALRCVHLIPSSSSEISLADPITDAAKSINASAFQSLESPVSEGGENFLTGEKQLLCMACAILERSKVLVMDEATASVDYGTNELIGKIIRQEFAKSPVLTVAHCLRTVIDYD
ncbi:hypothetical protein CONPUDRAFT_167619 [Coniophora puteana RWD-64-598 SS2]|uniref:P-loop containing nucleoside triphosphate hydrolase protein n=1 Tax=Coniophora puteana (strain RWD-64-598) TaxID=741705 RepID=A0A5M3MIB0_CONPW|nr:uncharacterized protein CONPUDRAFT_167619 [Coniophora puteana RWD-64-598 SS2]EIW78660.1 hypothetical protein CONPUDRAFT_167619 [Coniophora puteana RWD-64-598 SS2]